MFIESNIFKNLGLVPEITNVYLENKSFSKLSANFRINVPYSRLKSPWILNEKILKYLNIIITVCSNQSLYNALLTSKKEWLYTSIPESQFKEGIDYHQITKKLQNSYLHYTVEQNDTSNILQTGFTEDIVLQKEVLQHLSIFTSVTLDKEELAKKFNVNVSAYKNINGFHQAEVFIKDSKQISQKLNNISVFLSKEKFTFNSIDISSLEMLFNDVLKLPKNFGSFEKTYSSELFYSVNENFETTGFFYVDILQLFKNESRISSFFNRLDFQNYFFSLENQFLPKTICISRENNQDETVKLYEGIYSDFITTDLITLSRINLTTDKKLYLAFLDKSSKEYLKAVKYKVSLTFQDYTQGYIKKIGTVLNTNLLDIQRIINYANSGKYYNPITNSFVDDFYIKLTENNLAVKNTVFAIINILGQFVQIDSTLFSNLNSIANSSYYNFEILEHIQSILYFLESQIALIVNALSQTSKVDIQININFKTIVDREVDYKFIEEVIPVSNELGFPQITKTALRQRISQEILKYYGVVDITNTQKASYFSPSAFGHSLNKQNQDIIDFSKVSKYNNYLIDMYYDSTGNKSK